MSKKSINVCLIGQKFMGRAHSNAFLKAPKFFDLPVTPVMHTVAARDAGSLKAFAEKWGWKNTSTHWQEAIANPEIDLVDITSQNHLHREMGVAALEAGNGYELYAVAATVIGGTSLFGGQGGIPGTVIGALLMFTIRNGCALHNLPSAYERVIVGAVVILAVLYDRYGPGKRRAGS